MNSATAKRGLAHLAVLIALVSGPLGGQAAPAGTEVVEAGRFSFAAMPGDAGLARALLAYAQASDTFPGLPRPRSRVRVLIAPDDKRFREWAGGAPPEWGVAVAFPGEMLIVMHGRSASARAGNPRVTLRHELAHLCLHEALGPLPPPWFDEGYASFAAREWSRDQVLESSPVIALMGAPRFAALDTLVSGGAVRAERGYALAQRAVADLAALDPERGLSGFFRYWAQSRRMDTAMREAYGLTLDGFEDVWRKNIRRRYGSLAIVADVGFASLVLFLVVAPLWIARRRRDRRRLAALVAADELQARRERAEALAALLGEAEQNGEGGTQSRENG